MVTNRHILTIAFIFLIFKGWSQESEKRFNNDPLPLDSTVRYGKLENGFSYYLKNNNDPNGEVVLKMVVKAGSFHTDKDQAEYAHLLEHIAVRETEKFKDLGSLLRVSGIHNTAHTERLATEYTLQIPSCNIKQLELGLDVLQQWAGRVVIDSTKLKMHTGGIIGELRPNDSYSSNLFDKKARIILQNISFPFKDNNRSVASMKGLSFERLKEFYQDWYRPDLEAAIVVGPINIDSLENVIKTKFGSLPTIANPRDPSPAVKKLDYELSGSNQYEQIHDSLNESWKLNIVTKRPNFLFKQRSKEDFYKAMIQDLYETIIENRTSSYLRQYDPEFSTNSLAYYGNGISSHQVSIGLLAMGLGSDPDGIKYKIEKAIKADKVIHSNFTQRELEQAKEKIKSHYITGVSNSPDLANKYSKNFVYQNAIPSPGEKLKIAKIFKEIKLPEVQDFSDNRRNFLTDTDFIFINVPQEFIPSKKDLEKSITRIYREKMPVFKSPLNQIENVEQVVPINNSSTYKVEENTIGVSTVTLENNIKILLKPTAAESTQFQNRIEILGFQPIRFNGNTNYKYQLLSHSFANIAGTAFHNRFQLEDFKRTRNMRLQFDTDRNNFLIEGDFYKKDLKEFFNLLMQYVKTPETEPAAFVYWKNVLKERFAPYAIKGGSAFFQDRIERIWNPKYPLLSFETLDQINQEDLEIAYKDHFSDFGEYTFVITGDFDSEEIIELIAPYIAELPVSKKRIGKKISNWRRPLNSRTDTLFYQGIEQSFSKILLPVKIDPTVKNQVVLDLVNTLFYERLFKVLRLDCYAPSAGGEWMDLQEGLYTFQIGYDSELGNQDVMFKNAIEEIDKIKKEGVDQQWLLMHIQNANRQFKRQINSFGYFNFWPQFLKSSLEDGRNYEDYIVKYPGILENFISLEDIENAVNNYITTKNLQRFLVLPQQSL